MRGDANGDRMGVKGVNICRWQSPVLFIAELYQKYQNCGKKYGKTGLVFANGI